MKYFAKLGLNSKVTDIISVNDIDAPTEKAGIENLNKLYSYPFWVETTKDGSIRKNGAGIGYAYDEDKDAFIAPKPYSSWILNETICQWEATSEEPDDGKSYFWNEETTSWEEKA